MYETSEDYGSHLFWDEPKTAKTVGLVEGFPPFSHMCESCCVFVLKVMWFVSCSWYKKSKIQHVEHTSRILPAHETVTKARCKHEEENKVDATLIY
jgi:hypothetical protein